MTGVVAGHAARRVGALLVALAVVCTGVLVGARPAAAAEGYRLESTARYVVDPPSGSVAVEVVYRMTNTRRDRDLGNGRVQFFFYEGVRVPIDAPDDGLTDLVVLVDGEPAEARRVDEGGASVLDVDFPFRLRYGRTATVTVRYRLVGAPPRTDGSFVRVNPAYVSFPVYVFADDGDGDVVVDVPADWTTDYVGGEFDDVRRSGDRRVFEAQDVTASEFGVLFTARLDAALASTPVVVEGASFEIRSWPGDDEWRDFAERHVRDGVPALERLVGTPWPERNETDVIQASTPYLRGYAGYYYADTDVIEVGEQLDAHTVLHELSHAWLNDEAIAERWISEGLADEIGARAVEALGGALPGPSDYDDPDAPPPDVDPFPLNEWGGLESVLDDDTEYYGYRTSFSVMRELRDEIGEGPMSELVAAILAGHRAYGDEQPDDDPVLDDDPVDWREFLDLAEQIGGSTGLVDTYRELVVADRDLDQLDRRDELVEQYGELAARGGSWAPPEAVRAAMARWLWLTAADRMIEAEAVLDARDALAETLRPIGLEPAASIEEAYQASTDLPATGEDLANHRLAAERLVEARQDAVEDLDAAGFDAPPLTQGDYDAAPLGIALDVETSARLAGEVRDAAADLDDVLASGGLTVPELPPDAFVESPAALIDALTEQLDAARAVAGAQDARDDASSILERIGAVGSDVDADLARAAAALSAGDTDAANSAAAEATDTLDGFRERGTARLVAVALGLVLGLAAVALASRLRRAHQDELAGDAVLVALGHGHRDDRAGAVGRDAGDGGDGAVVDLQEVGDGLDGDVATVDGRLDEP